MSDEEYNQISDEFFDSYEEDTTNQNKVSIKIYFLFLQIK